MAEKQKIYKIIGNECQWQSKNAPDGGAKVHHFCS